MKKAYISIFCLMALTLMFASAANAKTKSFSMMVASNTTVAGVALKAGDYHIVVDETAGTATFLHDGTQVVRCAVHLTTGTEKFPTNEMVTDSGVLKEIHLGGSETDVIIDGLAK